MLHNSDAQAADREGRGVMSAQTAMALQVGPIRQVLSAFAATELGAEAVVRLQPLDSVKAVEQRRELLKEMEGLVAEGGVLIAATEAELLDALRRLGEARGIGTKQLLALAVLLERFDGIVQRLGSSTTPALFAVLRDSLVGEEGCEEDQEDGCAESAWIEEARRLANRVRTVLDSSGAVRNDASPALAALVSGVRKTREALYSSFSSYAREHGETLSDDTVMRSEGRLALLLPAGSRGRVAGVIHGRSASEKSYYFEPLELVEENNKLQEKQAQEEAERERLLVELAGAFEDNAHLVARIGDFVETIDMLQAAHRFGLDLEGQFPQLSETDASWQVHGAKHPLLDPRLAGLRERELGAEGHRGDVVPLDIMAGDDRVLVITGPNAGGKTVALKTLGVLTFLAACGWPVPFAASPPSRLPLFKGWIAVVGDEQDVLAEQSTFSARLTRLREVWETASEGTLVLLDEVGSGTNPEEGAALSIALLERLVERGCFAVMTTHLLQVANAALALEGCASLAMELDADTGAPTYKIRSGAPGSSHALDLARRLGLAPEWLQRAEELLGKDQMTLRHLISETEKSRQRAGQLEDELRALSENQQVLQRRQEEELVSARQERTKARKVAAAELERFRRTARDELTRELKKARTASEGTASVRTASKQAARTAARLVERNPLAESLARGSDDELRTAPEATGSIPSRPIAAGDPVRHRLLGWSGKVDRLVPAKGKQPAKADVLVRGKRMRCGVEELEIDAAALAKSGVKHRFAGNKPTVTVNTTGSAEAAAELMLVGQRVAPALDRLDGFIERAIVANLEQVRVIHGFGSGRLKEAVRAHLKGHPMIDELSSAPASMGGDGATVVSFRTE